MRVLAMAYKGRPLDRELVGSAGNVGYIRNVSNENANADRSSDGVGFPKNCLFEFDDALFDSLQAAWVGGDAGAVERLWGAAKPLSFQDEVLSVID